MTRGQDSMDDCFSLPTNNDLPGPWIPITSIMEVNRVPIKQESSGDPGAVIKYNLSKSSISDQTLRSLDVSIDREMPLTNTELKGSQKLREIIASTAGGPITAEDVLVIAGTSCSLSLVSTALLSPDDHMVVTRLNDPTNLDVFEADPWDTSYIDLHFDEKYRLNLNEVSAAIRMGRTKLISVCSPHHLTGTFYSDTELQMLAKLAKENNCYLLVDETFAHLKYSTITAGHGADSPPCAASRGDHVISISSFSHAYGVPGVRIGWLVTTNKNVQAALMAGKQEIGIGNSMLDELLAAQVLSRRDEVLRIVLSDMRKRKDRVARWIAGEKEWLDWVPPRAGVSCLVKFRREPVGGIDAFYDRLSKEYGVYVGRGRSLQTSDFFFRLGFGWPTIEDLEAGLARLSKALRGAAGASHPDFLGQSLIHHAASAGDTSALKQLLDSEASHPDISDRRGHTPLHLAAENGHCEAVAMLFKAAADVNRRNKDGRTALHLASRNGHLLVVQSLVLAEGIDVNMKDNNGSIALHGAAKNGHADVISLLLQKGIAEPDRKDNSGNTPLHLAARNGHKQVVRQLLETGMVDSLLQDSYGDSSLYVASLHGHMEVVSLLLAQGPVDPDSPSTDGTTPIFAASRFGHVEVVEILLRTAQIDLRKRHKDGDTALHAAAESGSTRAVRLLLDTGVLSPNERGQDGETPLMRAAKEGQNGVVQQLVEVDKANVHLKDDKGKSALHHSLDGSHWELAKYLADVEMRSI